MALTKKKEEPKAVIQEAPISREEKLKRLEQISAQLDKQNGQTNTLVRLGSKVKMAMPVINLGLPTLDYEVLGVGGIPRGRIIEVYGPESSGKTTLALEIIAAEQKAGGLCAFIDAEHALSPAYAHELGVNVDDLLVSQPGSGEEALNTAETLVDSKCVSLIVVDSVAALVPKAELEGEMGDAHVGLQPRLMSQAMRKLVGKVSTNNVVILFINQIREKVGVMYGSPEVTSGGRALRFYASVRLDVRRKEPIKIGERLVGHKLHVKAVKNKVYTPFHECDLELYYPDSEFVPGLDKEASLIEYAVLRGIITQKGAWYYDGDNRLGQGLDNAKENLRDNPAFAKTIYQKVDELIAKERA